MQSTPDTTVPCTHRIFLKVDQRRIYWLKFLLEAYDGLATMSTVQREKGILLLRVPPERLEEMDLFLLQNGPNFSLEKVLKC